MKRLRWLSFVLRAAVLGGAAPASAGDERDPTPAEAWCAPELEAIVEGVCYSAPSAAALQKQVGVGRTVVIFLHALVGDGTSWQWEQQRLMARTAEANGLYALLPRGRLGIGPGRDPKVWAWPTAKQFQETLEESILAEWAGALAELERRAGAFDRVLVFGFSNGAYYASSLALRGKLEIDGYAVFAGGSGGKYAKLLGAKAARRVPIFVAYGTKDPDSGNQRALVRTLAELGWPHAHKGDRIGHTVSNAQVRGALAFLRGSAARADEAVEAANGANGPPGRQR